MREESRLIQLELIDVALDTALLPTELFHAVHHQPLQRTEAIQVDDTQVGVCLERLGIVRECVNRVLDAVKGFYLPIDKVNTIHLLGRNILCLLPD
jgi:hypothetical protein